MATEWLDELNPAQREAATHGDGPLLVIAGAGSGKTRTLVARVAYLIQQGVPAERILLLTFTRRSAAEMIRRVKLLVGMEHEAGIWGGTFHSIATRLLHMYGRAVGLQTGFTIMDQGDAGDLMNLIRSELGVAKGDRRFPRKQTLVKIYSHTVNAQSKLGKTLERHFPWCMDDQPAIADIFREYTRRKRARNVVDYDDLLLLWRELCRTPGVGEAVSDHFDHILVDEYQDTNTVQADILRAMRTNLKNIMVVGDDAQSIYSFRAATIRNILDFPEQFADSHVVTLEQNYRSTEPILAASNAVMDQAKQRFTKKLWSNRHAEQKPLLLACMDEADQSRQVVQHILEHLESGIPLQHQAVLFRAAHHSNELEVLLSRKNIPFHKYGGLKFIEAAHVKDMLAGLRVLENPYDEISWFRLLQMLQGVGPRGAHRILDALGVRTERGVVESDGASDANSSPLRRLFDSPPSVPPKAAAEFEQLRVAFMECEGAKAGKTAQGAVKIPVAAQVERFRVFYEPICLRSYERNSAVRLRDLDQLARIATGYKSRARFIADLTLDPPVSTADLADAPFLEEDYLILSTIHSAKGCEWDVVHVIHVTDGNIPSDMALSDDEGVEEERRLLYVAMTRAKDML